MATYGTDLTTLANADSDSVETTWTEMASPYNAGGTPADDDENLIQGTNCQSQTTGSKSGLVFSIVYNNGSGVTWTSGEVFLIWSYYAVTSNLETFANGGLRAVIGASTSNADAYKVSGSDNAYEGTWRCVAVDPEKTHDYLIGSGAGTTYQYIGMMPYTLANISKGTPHAVDAIRYGRGEIYGTGTGCDYSGYAQYNDYNDSTNGYNRWGLFSELYSDTYLWKGLFSFGQSGTSATFSDSNKTILIEDTPAVTSGFNKIEVQNASTSVTLTNVSFTALGTTSIGAWENVANATVTKTGCVFNGMGTFEYGSNTTSESTYNACGQITTEGADMNGSSVLESVVTADTGAVYQDVAYTDTYLDNMTFKSHATTAHHAIDFGTAVTSNLTLRNCSFEDFGSTDDANDSTVRFLATSGSLTLSLVNCTVDGSAATTSNFSVDDAAGISVTLSIDPVTTKVHVNDHNGDDFQNVRVFLKAKDATGDLPFEETVTSITRSGTTATVTHTGHGLKDNEYIDINGITDKTEDNWGAHQITLDGVDPLNKYSYTTTDSGSTSYTGTIKVTGATIYGLTDVNGDISTSRTYGSNQPLTGYARKASAGSTYYKTAEIDTTVDSSNGVTVTVKMILDE